MGKIVTGANMRSCKKKEKKRERKRENGTLIKRQVTPKKHR